MTQEVRSLSYSQISALLRCARAYQYHYLEKIPTALPARMLLGRCYHHMVAVAASRKVLFNEIISPEEIADTFTTQWNREMAGKLVYDELGEEKVEATIIEFGDDDPEELRKTITTLAQMYVSNVLPKLKIEAIEKRLTGNVDGIPLVGYADLILAPGTTIIDHKTGRRKSSQDEADKDIQFSMYALLLGKPITGQFHMALDQKEPKLEIVETKRTKEDIERARELVRDSWSIIQNGAFPRNETWWGCGEGCGYWMTCKKGWF